MPDSASTVNDSGVFKSQTPHSDKLQQEPLGSEGSEGSEDNGTYGIGEPDDASENSSEQEITSEPSEANLDQEESAKGEEDFGEYQEEPEETIEELRPKVIKLCNEIGYPEPTSVDDLAKGSFHRVLALTFVGHEHPNCVLRIPEYPDGQKIKSQIASLSHLAQYDALLVPQVLAYDTTKNNALSSEYILQQRVPGVTAESVYYTLPLAEKLEVATQVARYLLKMGSIEFNDPGYLVAADDIPATSHNPSSIPAEIKFAPLHDSTPSEISTVTRRPLPELLESLLGQQLKHEKEGSRANCTDDRFIDLDLIISQMKAASLFRTWDDQSILWHWDFEARNVMIERRAKESNATEMLESDHSRFQWVITGIIDWDDVLATPRVLTRAPPTWLWFGDDERDLGSFWEGNNDFKLHRPLTADELTVKGHFDQIMSNASPTYMDDTYGRGIWLRRVARFGLHGFFYSQDWKRFDVLCKEWDEFYHQLEW